MPSSSRERRRRRGAAYPHLARIASLSPSRMRLGLDRIARVLDRLGEPQRAYPSVLVAGTNGKGSVTTYTAAILRAAGLKVGVYYSPHIFRLHERIRCDGAEISSRELDSVAARVRAAGGKDLTYFEALTAAAMLFFREREVDVAVFEVGLGGRLDATNLVDPSVTVITGISIDHRERLGATKQLILAEKLGILRPGVPLVARLDGAALERQALRAASAAGAPCRFVRRETRCDILCIGPDGMKARLEAPRGKRVEIHSRMIGAAQAGNIATAALAIDTLDDVLSARRKALKRAGRRPRTGLDRLAALCAGRLGMRAVREGVAGAFLPGRFQIVSREPLVAVDVSHNEESYIAALDTLKRLRPSSRSAVVFGMMAHKEVGAFPARAIRAVDAIVVTALADRRSASARKLASVFRRASPRGSRASILAARGVGDAVAKAKRAAGGQGVVLVLGSHVAVEEAAPYL